MYPDRTSFSWDLFLFCMSLFTMWILGALVLKYPGQWKENGTQNTIPAENVMQGKSNTLPPWVDDL